MRPGYPKTGLCGNAAGLTPKYARETVGHWEADLVTCRRSRPVLVLHERKTRITLMTRLAGKTAAETIAAMMATFRRLDPRMRGSFVGTTVHWTVV